MQSVGATLRNSLSLLRCHPGTTTTTRNPGDDSCSESDGSDDDDDEVAGGEAALAYATVKLCAEAPRSRSPPLAARVVLAEPRVPPPAIVEVSFTGKML